MGNHETFVFYIQNIPHEVAIYGYGNYKSKQLIQDIKKIVKVTSNIFKDIPYKKYLFLFHFLPGIRGGLEHINSTTIQADSWLFSSYYRYADLLSLIAHEYFHLWNVKRLKPIELGPFDYDKENYTKLLWFVEGITTYYDEWIIQKAKFIREHNYLKILSHQIRDIEYTPGRKEHSLECTSFDAWIKFYRKDENYHNTSISYYLKGSIISLLLDISIIEATDGKKSLADVMRYLYNRFYKEEKKELQRKI